MLAAEKSCGHASPRIDKHIGLVRHRRDQPHCIAGAIDIGGFVAAYDIKNGRGNPLFELFSGRWIEHVKDLKPVLLSISKQDRLFQITKIGFPIEE